MPRLPKGSGFTLVEMLLTITIISILATVVMVAFNPFEQLRKANDTKRKSDLAQLQRALELYYHDFGSYPSSSSDFKILMNASTVDWGASWSPYMSKLPSDPSSGRNYVYYSPVSSGGQTYYIYASLERGNRDQQTCNNGNACTTLNQSGSPASNACGGTCNYGVSSSNVAP